MNDKFDKNGQPLELMEWARLVEDREYSRVALTELPNGIHVSTIWLGLDHSFGSGPPLIFETMVFGAEEKTSQEIMGLKPFKYHEDLDMDRYSTLEEAEKGHEAMVKKYS